MNELSRILRYWVLLTILFISLASAFVTGIVVWRTWQAEEETRVAQKELIERHILVEYARISEEVYLNLDNWETRQKEIESIVGHRAGVAVRFVPSLDKPLNGNVDFPRLNWTLVGQESGVERLTVPLFFGDLLLGEMLLDMHWESGWAVGGIGRLSATAIGSAAALIAVWMATFLLLRRKVFAPLFDRLISFNRAAAISEATQMIAHDVRKPFHSLRLCLETMRSVTDAVDLRQFVEEAIPGVEASAAEVEDMLREIIATEKPPDDAFTEASIQDIVVEVAQRDLDHLRDATATIECTFAHSRKVQIDVGRVRRVIANVVRNGLQATKGDGRLWIRTRDVAGGNQRFVEVCVGNGGSRIAKEDIALLFDSFFTKGKADGTGLGLAIAKKFVEAHGGKIWCESSEESGTEFFFTLPATASWDQPSRGSVVLQPIASTPSEVRGREPIRAVGLAVTGTTSRNIGSLALRILVVEDDRIYRKALVRLIFGLRNAGVVADIDVIEAASAEEAVKLAATREIDLIVLDNDLGDGLPRGVDIIPQLRQQLSTAFICLHSSSPELRSIDEAPNLVLSKPMDVAKAERLLGAARKHSAGV